MNNKKNQIEKILKEKVNPVLEEHYGGAELVEIKDNTVYVRMTGACGTCPLSQMTLENVIEEKIKGEMPEIERVTLYQGVSDDLIDMAKKILNKEIK
ncbi:Fe-S cluster biogenesis protein NfuA [Sedimentibacter acidaminivorans]|uniref:Fe-S cluster biogenesis protein NfuA n=1 Tax=Sedimentibacter acidaminivorans TaxID=913099 RepID=A0ABS4G9M0_9FIRM|nr:NifU family protein [Sedimentibacter acidaminivorans]MBP1924378.1 Fe-S cluster biogenesis protein NfuA [Sedimentibacter acidaminivorans]